MVIEIHQPKLEALIHQRMKSGQFQSVEELLQYSLEPEAQAADESRISSPESHLGEQLVAVCAQVKDLTWDLCLERDTSPGRTTDLS